MGKIGFLRDGTVAQNTQIRVSPTMQKKRVPKRASYSNKE